LLGVLGYHDYEGIAVRDDEKPRLQASLGKNYALILRNHGLLTVGPTVADAFQLIHVLQRACEIQLMAQTGGAELISISDEIVDGAAAAVKKTTGGVGGMLAWPGLLRRLQRQNPGYDA